MSKTKTIPLEVPEEWEFERAVADDMLTRLVNSQVSNGQRVIELVVAKLTPITSPTWTWCENPTDEMAKLRPDCEVRDWGTDSWSPNKRRLVAVVRSSMRHVTINDDDYVSLYRFCRVRLDRDGKVIVRWGDVDSR